MPSSKYYDFSVGSFAFFFKPIVFWSASKLISYSDSSITVQSAFSSSMDAYFSKEPLPSKMSSLGPTGSFFGTTTGSGFSSGVSSFFSVVSYPSLDSASSGISTLSFFSFSESCVSSGRFSSFLVSTKLSSGFLSSSVLSASGTTVLSFEVSELFVFSSSCF